MEKAKARKPVVAGSFYPSSIAGLNQLIASFVGPNPAKQNAIACILPHAGYVYSGKVAVKTVAAIYPRKLIILLGPNHTGLGAVNSVMTAGLWETPLGRISVASNVAQQILEANEHLTEDSLGHLNEHSIEVELPIFQYFNPEFQIVPVALMQQDIKTLQQIGKDIAAVIIKNKLHDDCLLVASSDMTHYEPQETARKKDKAALEAILKLDEVKLWKTVNDLRISMCGIAPAIVMLSAAKILGADKAELISYQTSGDVTQDFSNVVGYAGVIIYG